MYFERVYVRICSYSRVYVIMFSLGLELNYHASAGPPHLKPLPPPFR